MGVDDPNATVDVIVQYKHKPGDTQFSRIRNRNGIIRNHLDVVNGAALTVPVSELSDLDSDPDVAYVSPDRPVRGEATSSIPLDYDYTTVNANLRLAARLRRHRDRCGSHRQRHHSDRFRTCTAKTANSGSFIARTLSPAVVRLTLYGHGSHVAGIIGGNGNNSTGWNYSYTFDGIAPNVNLINLRVLDQNGQGTDSYVIAAINQAIKLQSKYNIRVINLSLGRQVYESYTLDPLCQAVEAGMEGRHRGSCSRGQSGPQQLGQHQRIWHHCCSRERSLRDHRRRHEDGWARHNARTT